MYKKIENTDGVIEFARSFTGDPFFSDPNHENEAEFRESLDKYISKPETYRTIGIFHQNTLTGLFSFLVIPEERYVEMLIGVSRSHEAYLEMMDYLTEQFSGYECFFVFNPKNFILDPMLRERGAEFDTEQAKMDLKKDTLIKPSDHVIAFSDRYKADYRAIHREEGNYWKADKVLACPERFHVFLALDSGKAVGYIDMEHSHQINEPFDLFVAPEYRRRGYGRALLEAAIVWNRPKGMMLHVDIDNTPAMNLYSSMGFEVDEFGCSVVARFVIAE